jgi:hypothetical protein
MPDTARPDDLARVHAPKPGRRFQRPAGRTGWDALTPAEASKRIVRMFRSRDRRLFGDDGGGDEEEEGG